MKILDRYIIRNFIGTFLFMVAILSAIVVIIDVSSKLDRINNSGSNLMAALTDFYPYWIVWIINTFMPVAVFISAIYFTSRLTMRSEYVAALAGGVSVVRLTKPYLMVAIGILTLSLFVNNFMLPWANIKKNEFYYNYMLGSRDRGEYESRQKISAEIAPNEYIFVQSYDRIKKKGNNFVYQKFDSINQLKEQIFAREFDWNQEDSAYVLKEYFQKYPNFKDNTDSLKNGNNESFQFAATPDDILPEEYVAETMNSVELKEFIEKQKFKGSSSINTYENELFQRFSSPFSTVILTIFAFAISSRKRRGGIGINLAIGLFLAFGYVFFGESSKVFSEKEIMSPAMASWLPNICFGIIAAILYYRRIKD